MRRFIGQQWEALAPTTTRLWLGLAREAMLSSRTISTSDRLLPPRRARGPSVLQVRTQDVSPTHLESLVVTALRQHEDLLLRGALITVDEARLRSRILPIGR